ncbi:MAG: MerC domain-containing protein [Gammaproteobacteria bacterium]|nr:MerC domain-containing protein [Gammaproteobacteria bacterium]MDH4316310.1 MerC domain-containing protein [Gammaproteobacteria bacterium]MDH5215736.1 MerC domain-containing protein [Gammaproteobacteria bacterium]MDH5502133.1 MerC domain-containing protein [Gammaproteobacteria bacterium]
MDNSQTQANSALDRSAVALSGLCLLHCLALPFFVGLLPFAGLANGNGDHFHLQMLVVVLPVSLLAFALGYRRHRTVGVLLGGAIGLALLIAGATVVHDQLGSIADRSFTVAAALILAVAHFYNARFAKHSSAR